MKDPRSFERRRWRPHHPMHQAMHRAMHHAMRHGADPREHFDHRQRHAAMHEWLREFEARALYGLDERWSWRRGTRASLSLRLTLLSVLLAAGGGLLAYAVWTSQFAGVWLLLGGLVLVWGAHIGIHFMLRPLRELAWGVAAFGRGDLKHRIPVRRRDEMGALAARFNRMAEDIGAMLDGKRALLLAISHELRSPITRARLNVELLDDSAQREALVQDLSLMRDLIEGLLERERLDAGHGALLVQDTSWQELVDELLARRFSAAVKSGALIVTLDPALPRMAVDRMRMQLLIGNLVDNALRHNEGERGAVQLSLQRQGAELRLVVRDFGSGVPEDVLPQLGQAFFRPDQARTRAEGGIGLGLNLCRLIAAAHGSELQIRNADPGLEASLRLALT